MDIDSILAQASSAHTSGALEDAEVLYRHLLECAPDHLHALYLLSVLYLQTGRYPSAIPLLERLLELNPKHVDALMHLGFACRESGDVQRAETCYRQVLVLDPANSQAHFNLAELYQFLGRLDEALVHYGETVKLAPTAADAWFNQGVLYYTCKNFPAAEMAYRQFLVLRPDSVEAHYNLGSVLHDIGKLDEAKFEYLRALALKPDLFDAHRGIGNILMYERDYAAAVDRYRQALVLKPDDVELKNNLGVVLQKLNRLDEALVCFREALQCVPGHINAHFNLALVLLLKGNFAEGWAEYEWRRRIKGRTLDILEQSEWDGASLAGKTILIRAEQGFGDTFQFIRYAPLVKARGGRVIFECQAGLQRLLRSVEGIDEITQKTASGKVLGQFDTYIPLLSLPRVFHTDLDSIPAQVPYIKPEPWLAERWRARLAADRNLKIGFVWAGRPTHEDDRNRSAVLSDFFKLAHATGISLYSLQKGSPVDALASVPPGAVVTNLDAELEDFADTAAAIANLDLVISVDTSVAHLAGALGKPVWVLLPYAPDWRWLMEREDSPWYPTMRLFRQPQGGNWDAVFEQVSAALAETACVRHSAGRVPWDSACATDFVSLIERAWMHRKLGEDTDVLVVCQAILDRQPDHAEANYLAGVVYLKLGQHQAAQACLAQALAGWPEHPGVLKNLGVVYQILDRLEDAAACYSKALKLGNEEAEIFYNLGSVRLAQGAIQEAVNWFERVLEYQPVFAEALNNLGLALQRLDKHEAAIDCFKQALQARADFFDAQLNLGNALYVVGRAVEAETVYRGALSLQPASPALHNSLGVVLKAQGRLEESIQAFRFALSNDAQYGEAYNNLGNSLKALDDLSGAVENYRSALRIDPGNASALNNLGNALQAQGEEAEALLCFNRAVELKPDFAEAHWNRAIVLLLEGDYAQGWREYEWGFAAGQRPVRNFSQPRWQGEDFSGKTLLVYAEQGFGDTLQFVRFLSLVKARGGRVLLECQPELMEALRYCGGVDELITRATNDYVAKPFDLQVPLMSLPAIFGITLEVLCATVPYLQAETVRVAHWREYLAGEELKVGIVWAGRPIHQDDRKRSCALSMFSPLFGLKGIRLFSLQKGPASSELREMPEVSDLAPVLHDFTDTAAVIMNLDLVVSVDTAVAHLAGALGKPVWVLLPYAPDWRWLLNREDSPWYPSARLFRQETAGNWEDVLLRVRDQLEELKRRGCRSD